VKGEIGCPDRPIQADIENQDVRLLWSAVRQFLGRFEEVNSITNPLGRKIVSALSTLHIKLQERLTAFAQTSRYLSVS
jgi:hypothetical protein